MPISARFITALAITALAITACTSSADLSSDAPVIGGETTATDRLDDETLNDADGAEPAPAPEPTVEPTVPPEPTTPPQPTVEPTAPSEPTTPPQPTAAPESNPEQPDTDPGSTEGDPALDEVTGRWAELGCQNGLLTRTVLGESEIADVVEQIPFRVWVCLSGDEVLEELLCYVEETEEILTAMETRMGDRGIRAAEEFRRTNAIFCSNPAFG